MKCFCDEAEYRKAWLAVHPTKALRDFTDAETENYYSAVIRVEASDGHLTLRGPYGAARIPARIERPGVLFASFREFMFRTEYTWDELPRRIEATQDRVSSNEATRMLLPPEFKLFDDPAAAPQTWDLPVAPGSVSADVLAQLARRRGEEAAARRRAELEKGPLPAPTAEQIGTEEDYAAAPLFRTMHAAAGAVPAKAGQKTT